MLQYLKNALASGLSIIPSHEQRATFIDAFTGFARVAGVRSDTDNPASRQFEKSFSQKDHLVFVLVDGLGAVFLPRLPKDSFLRKQCQDTLVSVFPSTTACALTSAASLKWPGEHGIPGWWGYLPQKDIQTIPLQMVERTTNRKLSDYQIQVSDVFPYPSFLERVDRKTYVVSNQTLANSLFSSYFRGKAQKMEYETIQDACQQVANTIQEATVPTSIYLYINELDKAFHTLGNQHPDALKLLHMIDDCLGDMANAITSSATVVVTADHGHIDIQKRDHIFLDDQWPLHQYLRAKPFGDTRIMHYFIKETYLLPFQDAFRSLYGSSIALLSQQEAQDLKLFGPNPLSSHALECYGDLISICLDPLTLVYFPNAEELPNIQYNYQSHHSGLSPDEILIPLIIA